MGSYLSVDVGRCRAAGHRFIVAGSDKTPMKKNLICETCTSKNPGQTAYAAYGIDTLGFGSWPARRYQEAVHDEESEAGDGLRG